MYLRCMSYNGRSISLGIFDSNMRPIVVRSRQPILKTQYSLDFQHQKFKDSFYFPCLMRNLHFAVKINGENMCGIQWEIWYLKTAKGHNSAIIWSIATTFHVHHSLHINTQRFKEILLTITRVPDRQNSYKKWPFRKDKGP